MAEHVSHSPLTHSFPSYMYAGRSCNSCVLYSLDLFARLHVFVRSAFSSLFVSAWVMIREAVLSPMDPWVIVSQCPTALLLQRLAKNLMKRHFSNQEPPGKLILDRECFPAKSSVYGFIVCCLKRIVRTIAKGCLKIWWGLDTTNMVSI